MRSRPGLLPTGVGWSFEPKYYGIRAVIPSRYGAALRRSVKVKNPNYWRPDAEREAMASKRQRRTPLVT
jgi:hypothetical protein